MIIQGASSLLWYFIKVRFSQEKNKLNVKKRCDIIKSAFDKFINESYYLLSIILVYLWHLDLSMLFFGLKNGKRVVKE